ncbi:MAG: trypsin-like serine protease [Phycisphaerales bacterium]
MRPRPTTPVVLSLAFALAAAHAAPGAIIRRHDRDDAAYIEHARPFTTVVRVGGGTGTLVGDRWVLTAAHVARGLDSPFTDILLGDARLVPDAVAFHPTWTGEGSAESVDMALIRLAEPVTDIEPSPLYEWEDEAGKGVTFVGFGMFGTGLTGPEGDDGLLRAASNTLIDAPVEGWVRFEFSRPPDATDLEGISGPGDSGGPAFIERQGVHYIAGVSSSNDAGGSGPCTYGSTEFYARVSTSAQWLRETMDSGQAKALDRPARESVARAGWPTTPAGAIAEAFFAAYSADRPMESFERSWRSAAALEARPASERGGQWEELRSQWGPLQPLEMAAFESGDLAVLCSTEGDRRSASCGSAATRPSRTASRRS